MNENVSIIVPVYNMENYLDQCITSILSQDLKAFRLILVDDGSTDSSPAICDRWTKEDERITVYHKTNGGLMSAWKYGVLKSKTEYVGFVDSDDWIDSDMFSRLLQKIEEKEADIAACGWISDKEDGSENELEFVKAAGRTFDRDAIRQELYPVLISGGDYYWMGLSPNRWSKLFRRDILLKILFYCDDRVSIGEDLLTIFAAVPHVNRITVLKDFHPYHYRIRRESMMHQFSEKNYQKIDVLRECLMRVNKDLEYDFSVQINTYYLKLMLEQLDNEMLFSGETIHDQKKRMKFLRQSKGFQDALKAAEPEKLPLKYKLYLKCIQLRCYNLLLLIRKAKKI